MAYIDPNYQVTFQDTVIGGGPALGVSLGTVTASATQTYTGTAGSQVNGTFRMPLFKTPVNILGLRVYCTAAAGGGVTGVTMSFLNGTQTLGSMTAPAVNTFADLTLKASSFGSNGAIVTASSPAVFTATNNEITMVNVAIGTASGSSLGSYSIDLIWQNLFVS